MIGRFKNKSKFQKIIKFKVTINHISKILYILILKKQSGLIIYEFYVEYIDLPSKSMKIARLTKVTGNKQNHRE